ncbi:hypothetical protein GIB67_003822 [Kingdonia uniflora]|uniref:Pectinesterase n=1 Tax=Kingdonia uniflora TaxID=39325 RepID=A0A7J7P316_9MAGN|nr:hypothetical protein GIB67_003822 [Kingdonia uniflora]
MAYGDHSGNSRRKKRILIISCSSLVLVAMVVAVAVSVNNNKDSSSDSNKAGQSTEIKASMKAINAICEPTDYRQTCVDSLSKAAGNETDPKELIKVGFTVAMEQIKNAVKKSVVLQKLEKDPRSIQALRNCHELMDSAVSDLCSSFDQLGQLDLSKVHELMANLKVWLSATITYQQTCMDGFENTTGTAGEKMRQALNTSSQITSNGLAIVTGFSTLLTTLEIPLFKRRLLTDDPPSWVRPDQRRHLLAATEGTIKADIVVAKDGSGAYRSINAALHHIPLNGTRQFVIYIKEGIYNEIVHINSSMTHVTLIGDGPTKTKITGSKNFADGVPTFNTATVAVIGDGFTAKDIGFENTAGPGKHQAVALRVQSDESIFHNCHIDGYQASLYTHTKRQFYRDCVVSGTIDIIWGNALAVFQNCKIVVRKPIDDQKCTVTAQARKDKREPTGIVLQGCTISADKALIPIKATNPSYLGRPAKEFSRTIIMNTVIDSFINENGWAPWFGTYGIDTCFYAEYANTGPGAVLTKRVEWEGIKTLTTDQVLEYTPAKFIGGDTWVKSSGVPYTSGMWTM